LNPWCKPGAARSLRPAKISGNSTIKTIGLAFDRTVTQRGYAVTHTTMFAVSPGFEELGINLEHCPQEMMRENNWVALNAGLNKPQPWILLYHCNFSIEIKI
jgi:hypothetical protein